VVIGPVGGGRWPGVLLYTDIFQLTESTLRTARRLASAGFAVFVPEIYPHGELAGVALDFDDAGKRAGLAGAAGTQVGQFDADRVAVLDFMAQRDDVGELFAAGFCLGGHLAFRAALDSAGSRRRSASTRPGCTTARSGRTPMPGRSAGPPRSRAG